ncbi:flavohemoglobin expression-modulating QEGLA motif protein [Zooshikella sp. RANM57]|uniref:flavohemoglobin expression-modulating QEGLA motif protein n=1 Tax=Zooshikella sp. RANM57 TaxID=3425863 RepID=UPI003D6F4D42
MQKRTEADIIKAIKAGEPFECSIDEGSFLIKVEDYVPFICTAIHNGSQLRTELINRCLLDEGQRYFEEDPYTGELVRSLPITLVACDSRYEYDLNRPLAQCVYKRAWGLKVWRSPLTDKQWHRSTEKHRQFYRILDVLIAALEQRFGACLVFDIHSYNKGRQPDDAPVFNLGLEQVDMDRWAPVIERYQNCLQALQLPNLKTSVEINRVFYGRGYMIAHVNSRFENTLVIPTEIKKVFMDEKSGELYPLVLQSLSEGMKHTVVDTAAFFARRFTQKKQAKRKHMLASLVDPAIKRVDRALYQLAKGVSTLHYVNPINIAHEMKRFFSHRTNYQPEFTYRQLAMDPYLLREKLYRLPVDEIRDAGIQQLYREVIDTISMKVDLLVSIGTERFIYNSLRYYGEPGKQDIDNARFLLYAPAIAEQEENSAFDAEQMRDILHEKAVAWGLNCKVETSSRLVAAAMVSNGRRALLVRKDAKVTATELQALAHHELGVHMVTTLNAGLQPLKVFSLGLPDNTLTQEGLAILSEHLSGNLTLKRLKMLALRVLAVEQMLLYRDFRHTWLYLTEEHHMKSDDAFRLTTRVHRGGGFTKDYLYLQGLCQALQLHKKQPIRNLFIGKTGFRFLPIINEMIERGMAKKPEWLPEFLSAPVEAGPVMDYLLQSIQPFDVNRHQAAVMMPKVTSEIRQAI